MIETKLRDLEGKFSAALMDLESNLSFLAATRRDLTTAKERFETSSEDYRELEASLEEMIEEIEGLRSEYVERFESELENLVNIKEKVMEAQRVALEKMESRLSKMDEDIKKDLFEFRKEIIVLDTKFNMRQDSFEKNFKNTEHKLDEEIAEINAAIGNIKAEAMKANNRMLMLFGIAILAGGIALALIAF